MLLFLIVSDYINQLLYRANQPTKSVGNVLYPQNMILSVYTLVEIGPAGCNKFKLYLFIIYNFFRWSGVFIIHFTFNTVNRVQFPYLICQ